MTKTTKPEPVARVFNDDGGAIVTKTHDIAAARDALLAVLRESYAYDDDEALDMMQPYLDTEPELLRGGWRRGRGDDGESHMFWHSTDKGRGITNAVYWSF